MHAAPPAAVLRTFGSACASDRPGPAPLFAYDSMHPKNVSAFIDQGLSPLLPRAARLLELQRVLIDALPPALARSCEVANLKQGKVLIFAENSAVAAKLRLIGPALRDRMAQIAGEVTGLEVQVQVPPQRGASRPAKPALSPAALRSLAELEEQLTDLTIKNAVSSLLASQK